MKPTLLPSSPYAPWDGHTQLGRKGQRSDSDGSGGDCDGGCETGCAPQLCRVGLVDISLCALWPYLLLTGSDGPCQGCLHSGNKVLVSGGSAQGSLSPGQAGRCGQMSRGLTMVKPESLLWLLSSSGLELALLEDAEAGPVSGSENTSGEGAGVSLFPDVLLKVRSSWAWPRRGPLALPVSSSLETRTKPSELLGHLCPGISGGACGVVRSTGG